MTVIVYFADRQEIELDLDADKWASTFEKCLYKGQVIQITEPSGGMLGINARAVLYWKAEVSDDCRQ